MLDMYRAMPLAFRAQHQMSHIELPFGIGLALKGLQSSLFNRCLFFRPDLLNDDDLSAAIGWLDVHASAARALDRPIFPARRIVEIAEQLGWCSGSAGLVRFGRGRAHVATPNCKFKIVEIDASYADDFGRVGQQWFELPESFRGLFAPLVGRKGWRCYLAVDGALPIACGALRLATNRAWLGIGATHPDYRGLGAQSALLGVWAVEAFGAVAMRR